MKRLLLGLLLLMTATAASAEWTRVGGSSEFIQYVDRATIRRDGNFVKMWDLIDHKTVQTGPGGESYLSSKSQQEYDCKEEKKRILAFLWFDGVPADSKLISFGRLCRSAIDHHRHSTNTDQCVIGTGGQFGGGGDSNGS